MKTLGVVALALAASFAPAFGKVLPPASGGAWMSVSGMVLSVDRRDRTIIFRHAPLETATGGTVRCEVIGSRMLDRLRRGDRIVGIAETDRHPWILGRTRILRVSAGEEVTPSHGRRLATRPGSFD